MSNQATFNPTDFRTYVQTVERKAGYFPTDMVALLAVYNTMLQAKSQWDAAADSDSASDDKKNPLPAVLLDGPPGAGKSELAYATKICMGAEYLQYNAHPDSSYEEMMRDINLTPIVKAMAGQMTEQLSDEDLFVAGMFLKAIQLSQSKPVVFLIDEMDKARVVVDALVLSPLNDGYVQLPGKDKDGNQLTYRAKPGNLMVFITKNDERELHPAVLRRCRVVNMSYPPERVETRLVIKASGICKEAAQGMVSIANKLRANGFEKPPSPPELMRLAQDLMAIAVHDVKVATVTHENGRNIYTELADGAQPPADAKVVRLCGVPRITLNQMVLNTLLARQSEQVRGRKVINDKSFGTMLLNAILRGLHDNDLQLRCVELSSLQA